MLGEMVRLEENSLPSAHRQSVQEGVEAEEVDRYAICDYIRLVRIVTQ